MPIYCKQRPSGRKYALWTQRVGVNVAFHATLYVYSIQIFTLRIVGMLDECSNVHSMQFDEANAVYPIQTE